MSDMVKTKLAITIREDWIAQHAFMQKFHPMNLRG